MSRSFVNLPTDRVIYGAGAVVELPAQLERLQLRRAVVVTGQTVATALSRRSERGRLSG